MLPGTLFVHRQRSGSAALPARLYGVHLAQDRPLLGFPGQLSLS